MCVYHCLSGTWEVKVMEVDSTFMTCGQRKCRHVGMFLTLHCTRDHIASTASHIGTVKFRILLWRHRIYIYIYDNVLWYAISRKAMKGHENPWQILVFASILDPITSYYIILHHITSYCITLRSYYAQLRPISLSLSVAQLSPAQLVATGHREVMCASSVPICMTDMFRCQQNRCETEFKNDVNDGTMLMWGWTLFLGLEFLAVMEEGLSFWRSVSAFLRACCTLSF